MEETHSFLFHCLALGKKQVSYSAGTNSVCQTSLGAVESLCNLKC